MIRYAIWYHFYNLKNVKNTHGGVLLLAKSQAKSCFMPLMEFIYMTFKWVSLGIFPWTQSDSNLEIKNKLNFNDFLWQAIFEISQIRTKYEKLEQISRYISFFETFSSSQPFISNHHQTFKHQDWGNILRRIDMTV